MRRPPDERRSPAATPTTFRDQPHPGTTLVEDHDTPEVSQGCRCDEIERRLGLIVEWLGVDVDVLAARVALWDGDLDLDVWLTSRRPAVTGPSHRLIDPERDPCFERWTR